MFVSTHATTATHIHSTHFAVIVYTPKVDTTNRLLRYSLTQTRQQICRGWFSARPDFVDKSLNRAPQGFSILLFEVGGSSIPLKSLFMPAVAAALSPAMTSTATQERGPTDLKSLEERARRLLRGRRYEGAAAAFKEVASVLQRKRLEKVDETASSSHHEGYINNGEPSTVGDHDEGGDDDDAAARREIGALEGLAMCRSLLLE